MECVSPSTFAPHGVPLHLQDSVREFATSCTPPTQPRDEIACSFYREMPDASVLPSVQRTYFCAHPRCLKCYTNSAKHRVIECNGLSSCECGEPAPYLRGDTDTALCKVCAITQTCDPFISTLDADAQNSEPIHKWIIDTLLTAMTPRTSFLIGETCTRARHMQSIMDSTMMRNVVPSEKGLTTLLALLVGMDIEELRVCTRTSMSYCQIILYMTIAQNKSSKISKPIADMLTQQLRDESIPTREIAFLHLMHPAANIGELERTLEILAHLGTPESITHTQLVMCVMLLTQLPPHLFSYTDVIARFDRSLSLSHTIEWRVALELATSTEMKGHFFRIFSAVPELFRVFLHIEKRRVQTKIDRRNPEGIGAQALRMYSWAKHSNEVEAAILQSGEPIRTTQKVVAEKEEPNYRTFRVAKPIQTDTIHMKIAQFLELIPSMDLQLRRVFLQVEDAIKNPKQITCMPWCSVTRAYAKKCGFEQTVSSKAMTEFLADGSFVCYALPEEVEVVTAEPLWPIIARLMSCNMSRTWFGPQDVDDFIDTCKGVSLEATTMPIHLL